MQDSARPPGDGEIPREIALLEAEVKRLKLIALAPRHGFMRLFIRDLETNPHAQYKVHRWGMWYWVINFPAVTALFFLDSPVWLRWGLYITLIYSIYANFATDYGAMSAAMAAYGDRPPPPIAPDANAGGHGGTGEPGTPGGRAAPSLDPPRLRARAGQRYHWHADGYRPWRPAGAGDRAMRDSMPSDTALIRDSRALSPRERERGAEMARTASDVRLPPLEYFNRDPCPRHASPDPLCRDCGIVLRPHQRAGIAWMYLRYGARGGLLADPVGSGKTAQVAGVLAICKQTGELSAGNRAVVVCQASAVLQWERELRRFLPAVEVSAVTGSMTRNRRVEVYLAPWEILIVSDRTFSSSKSRDGDVTLVNQFPVGIFIADDIDALRTHKTRTARACKALSAGAPRKIDINAEPLQKRLMEMHSHLELVGGNEVFGSPARFRRDFVKTGSSSFYQRALTCATPVPCGRHESMVRGCPDCRGGHLWPPPARRCPECGAPGHPDPTGRTVLRTVATDIGVKNLEEFRSKLAPFVLRRTEFGGEGYPAVQPSEIWVDLSPRQRQRYDELRRGILRRLREGGEEVTRAKAAAAFTRGAQICSGLAALDDGQDDSAKLDRLMHMLATSLEEEKVVCFVYFRENVRAASRRLAAAGIGHVLMWSDETDSRVRDQRVRSFTNDPATRVLVGTTTIARSLNLQASRHLVAVDTVLNPALMTQIAGRVRRYGSAFRTVFFHQMLARGTQEEGYLPLLRREQEVSDAVRGVPGDLFQGLSPAQQMRLITDGHI